MSQPPIDMEEMRAKALRAGEVLEASAWVFDEFIKGETEALLSTHPAQALQREEHFALMYAAAQIKGRLMQIIANYKAQETINGRRNPE